jgi:hypothetical protein
MSPAKQRLQNISSYQKEREEKTGFALNTLLLERKGTLASMYLCPKVYYIYLLCLGRNIVSWSHAGSRREKKRDTYKSGAGTERLQVRFIVISWRIRFAGNKIFAFLPTVRCTTDTIQRRL